jgi:uncharacterized protein YdeI (YjbR/CyaY-like superfamily)
MNAIEVKNRAEWRAWLAANHNTEKEIWLVYYKGKQGKSFIEYDASVEEALCYGWVDSIIKKLDDTKYARKFTPRKDSSKWSIVNKKRILKLIEDGMMTEHGLKKIEAAKRSGNWDNPVRKPQLKYEMPSEFIKALKENKHAQKAFENLSPTYQKQYLGWIEVAKLPETKKRRIKEAIKLLAEGKKLGLK